MSSNRTNKGNSVGGEGILGGIASILEKLGELADKGQVLRESGNLADLSSLDKEGKLQGVYGFTIRTGVGGDKDKGVKVEPFGNVRPDKKTGQPVVHEVREPMVDVFEETDHVLLVAEMPGISPEDIQLELRDDVLIIVAAKGQKKYRKEVLLPGTFSAESMTHSCHNGVLEVRFKK